MPAKEADGIKIDYDLPRSADFSATGRIRCGERVCRIAVFQTRLTSVVRRAQKLRHKPIGNRRYSRLETCATQRRRARFLGAIWQSPAMQRLPIDQPIPGLERTRHQLRATGTKDEAQNPLRSGSHTRGYLPHVKREGASYFVTFRLADSLPKAVLLNFEREKAERLRRLRHFKSRGETINDSEEEIARDFARKVERYLDRGVGACHLRGPDIADVVANAMRHFHESRYVLHEWVVMPNHVHVIVWPMPNHLLSDILKSWKQFTSRRAKKILHLGEEPFWQPESYDHWIRNDEERARTARYIRNNPVTAGLCARPEDWKWSSAYGPML
jgi:putative transposase